MPILSKPQRLGIGILVLLLVDVIWVSSSELTKVSLMKSLIYRYKSQLSYKMMLLICSTFSRMKTTASHILAHTLKHQCL